jgi:hypothetical protein
LIRAYRSSRDGIFFWHFYNIQLSRKVKCSRVSDRNRDRVSNNQCHCVYLAKILTVNCRIGSWFLLCKETLYVLLYIEHMYVYYQCNVSLSKPVNFCVHSRAYLLTRVSMYVTMFQLLKAEKLKVKVFF